MTYDEATVLNILRSNGKMTQREIAMSEPFLGCHEKHEGDVIPKSRQFETTLRKVRQIIRTLRTIYSQPILSDSGGYWLSNDITEAKQALERMERTAKAQSKSWHETYRVMQKNFGLNSDYFNGQTSLDL